MNLIYFIRLLWKNVWLIAGVALLMAVLVFLLTRNQKDSFSSEMVVYTGLATGYDIESGANARYDHFMTNAKFDNLINLIKSRQTLEETALRLMAQHLMLDQPDPRYCDRETWDALHDKVPREVLNLVHYPNPDLSGRGYILPDQPASLRRSEPSVREEEQPAVILETVPATRVVTETRMVTEKVRKTRLKPRHYQVKAGEYPIQIARRFGISLEQLQAMNPDGFPIYGGQRLRVGNEEEEYYTDTLVEKTFTREVPIADSVVYRQQRTVQAEPGPVQRLNAFEQMDSISEHFDQIYGEAEAHVQAFEATVRNLRRYKDQNETNFIYTTLHSSNGVYGIDKIARVRASRMQNSDLLRLTYENNDPGVCQQTLYFVYEVFRREFQNIKGAQTSMVSDYFRQQRDRAKIRLDSLEEYIKEYRSENRIINYNEQTKFIAEQNEELDRLRYEEMGKLSAAKAALFSIESQMNDHQKILVNRAEITNLRKEIGRLTRQIALEEIHQDQDVDLISRYKRDLQLAQNQMDEFMQEAFRSSRSTEGIQIEVVLQQWLTKVVEVEESAARLAVKTDEKDEFMKKYDRFAPMGSTLNKIEREIGLAEQEYLNQTHSLDLSLLKQKNSEQSNISIIDEPYYPIKPNPSKRMFIVIAAFLAGLMITAALLIFLEFVDTSIKFPERAVELTASKLIGAYPKVPSGPSKQVDYERITSRLIDMLTQKIKLEELHMPAGDGPVIVLLTSTRAGEGKTYIGSRTVEKLRGTGQKVLFIKPFERLVRNHLEEQFRIQQNEEVTWDYEYEIPDNFLSISTVNELIRNFSFVTRGYHYILIELPALLASDFPARLVAAADMTVLVCKATRTWNKADTEVLAMYKNNANHPVYSFINGVQPDNLESIIGEIPRKRSWFRKAMKRLINLDFKSQPSD